MKRVGFICKSGAFESHIGKLKASNYDVTYANSDSDFSKFDLLVIDLGLALDGAYVILERLRANFKYSEVKVIVAFSQQRQYAKLRSFAFGVDAYISPLISEQKLLYKVREILDPERHLLSKKIERKKVAISVDAMLTHISETGGLIRSKLSMSKFNKLAMKSELFPEMNLPEAMITKILKSNPVANKSFVSELEFSGLSDKNRDDIRKAIKNWEARE